MTERQEGHTDVGMHLVDIAEIEFEPLSLTHIRHGNRPIGLLDPRQPLIQPQHDQRIYSGCCACVATSHN